MHSKTVRGLVLALSALSLQSCYLLQSARGPLRTVEFAELEDTGSKDLMVLLPGIFEAPEAFADRGFIDFARASRRAGGFPFDVVAVDAHMGFYRNRTLLERLRQDVIEPARREGYERIHLLGVSLGGFGSLLYLRDHGEEIASVTLLAPYLGEEGAYVQASTDAFRRSPDRGNLWPWLAQLGLSERSKIFLGYGREDGFSPHHRRLARGLPAESVVSISGGHGWRVWSELWPTLVERLVASGLPGPSPDALAIPVVAER